MLARRPKPGRLQRALAARCHVLLSDARWGLDPDGGLCGTATVPAAAADCHGRHAQRTARSHFRDPGCVYMICFHKISPFHYILGEIPLFSQGHRASSSFLCDTHSLAVPWGAARASGSPPTPRIIQPGLFPSRAGGGSAAKPMLTCSGSDFIG